MTATSMFLFWTYRENSMLSRLTRAATDGFWSHMGIGFHMDDGQVNYFEALMDQGFAAPIPLKRLHDWAKEPGHHARLEIVPLMPGEPNRIYADTMALVGTVSYSKMQLAGMAIFERYGIPFRTSDVKVVCSEAVSRLTAGAKLRSDHVGMAGSVLDLRDYRRQKHDHVNPNSAWRRWCEIKAGCDVSGAQA